MEHVGELGQWVCNACGSRVYPDRATGGWSCPRHNSIAAVAAHFEPEVQGVPCPPSVLEAVGFAKESAE